MTQEFISSDDAEFAFYEAFRLVDGERMAEIWLPGDDVYCIHPNGPVIHGYDAVMESWIEIFSGARETAVEYLLVQSQGDEENRVHVVEEHVGSGANAIVALATNTYSMTRQGWKMTGHHASLKPGGTVEPVPDILH